MKGKKPSSPCRIALFSVVMLLLFSLLAGCTFLDDLIGSGSGGGNKSPTAAFAYSPSTVTVGTEVTLDASASSDPDGDSLTFTWELNPPVGSSASLSSPSAQTTSFTADVAGSYSVSLTVKDSHNASDEANQTITATAAAGNQAPVLSILSPADGAVDVATDVTLSWSGTDADGDPLVYQVYTGTSLASLSWRATTSGTSYNLIGLNCSQTYFWRVTASDGNGGTAQQTCSFTTQAVAAGNQAPVLSILSPADGAVDVATNVTLSWSGSDADGDALVYQVYTGTSLANLSLRATISNTSYVPGGLNNGTTYYWRIVASDGNGGTAQVIGSFTTVPPVNQVPVLSNPSPADGAVDVATNVTLSWSGSDADGDALVYEIYIGTDPGSLSYYDWTGTPSCFLGGLEVNTTYYWRIVASDGNGGTAQADWSFTTQAVAAGNQAPVLSILSPADGAVDVATNVTLSWSGSDADGDALVYEIYIGTDPGSLSYYDWTGTPSCFLGGLDVNTTYYWRIVASDGNGGTAEQTWSFTTKESAIDVIIH